LRTKKKTVVKIGSFEISRSVPVEPKAKTELAAPRKSAPKTGAVIGVSGNGPRSWGLSAGGEYLEKLRGARGRSIYDEMRRSDPQVKTILSAITLPLRQANWYVEPISDAPADVELAEEVEADFLRNMTITWDDTIRHILLMLPFGFSILEKVWEYRDNRIRPRKLDPRLPQSVINWKWDAKRRLIGPVQMDEEGTEILLPVEKLLIFTSDKEGDDWEGIPLLRPLYKPWFIKSELEKINAVKHDRHGVGTPKIHTPPGITKDSDEYADAVDMAEGYQAQELSYLIEPDGWVVDILGGGEKSGTDTLPSIQYYDEAMARAALTMFTMLGSTETGSRALGNSFIDIFRLSLQTFADYICEVMNRFAVREYIDYNYNATEYPELKARRIQEIDPQTLALIAQAGLVKPDIELENALRSEMNLPERKEDEVEVRTPPDDGESDTTEDPPADTEPDDTAEEQQHSHYADRAPTDEELFCDLAGIEMELNNATSELEQQILLIRDAQMQRIIDLIVAGRKVNEIAVPSKGDMFKELMRALRRQIKKGREQVRDELMRQAGRHMAFADVMDVEELLQIIEEKLQIKVEGAGDKLKAMLAELGLNLKETGLTGNELREGLAAAAAAKISDATWKNLASTAINQGWGIGRDIEQQTNSDEIEEVYRSGILDGNICPVCSAKDQVTHELGDPVYKAPDPECEGGPARCRCINIAILKAEREPAQ